MGTAEWIELVTALTQRDKTDKPKINEAEVVKLNDMPAPESNRNCKNHVRDEAKSCSDKPRSSHPVALAVEPKTSAAAQHRTQDRWEHDEVNKAWIKYHCQPLKPVDEGERVVVQIQVALLSSTRRSHSKVVLASLMGTPGGLYHVFTDDWETPIAQTHGFGTGKTVFCCGQVGPDKVSSLQCKQS